MIRRPARPARPIRARPSWRRACGWLLVLPFLFFATISHGTMLEAGPTGMRIVLCTEDGMVEAVMAADGQIHRMDDRGPDDLSPNDRGPNDRGPADHSAPHPCDWALHAQAALASGLPAADAAPLLALRVDYGIDIPLHARRVDVLTPAARGPPSLT